MVGGENMKLETTSTIDLIEAIESVETQMKLLLDAHEQIRQELIRRLPAIEQYDCFKELEIKRKDDLNEISKTKIL